MLAALALLLSPMGAHAQATLTSTTLSAAVTSDSTTTVRVTSATGFSAGRMLFVDKEAMAITAVSGTAISVQRGAFSTVAATHAIGSLVYVGPNDYFSSNGRSGSCTSANEKVLPVIDVKTGFTYQCYGGQWNPIMDGTLWIQDNLTAAQGVSPSYKGIYDLVTVPASVTGGTQNVKAVQGVVTLNASSAPAEIWGVYGLINSSGAPVSVYGAVGEVDIVASTPSNAAFGLLGTYDGQVSITATPTPTGRFSAAVAGQVWDRNTTGPTAIFLALDNGDDNRQAANPIGAAFKAINRHISFVTGFNYGLDLFIESGFSRGSLVASIRLETGVTIGNGTGVPSMNCQSGSISLRSGTGVASTVLYVCGATNTWTAVTVP
jgi:hypothetical protein